MKNLNNYIVEKLKLDSHLLKAQTTEYNSGETYSFDDFCNMVKSERNVEINDDPKNPYLEYAIIHLFKNINIKNVLFIDVTNDPKEMKFFNDEILSVYNKRISDFIEDYGIFTDSSTYNQFFHYFNTQYRLGNGYIEYTKLVYRYGYSIGNDLNDTKKLRLFKLEMP